MDHDIFSDIFDGLWERRIPKTRPEVLAHFAGQLLALSYALQDMGNAVAAKKAATVQ